MIKKFSLQLGENYWEKYLNSNPYRLEIDRYAVMITRLIASINQFIFWIWKGYKAIVRLAGNPAFYYAREIYKGTLIIHQN